MKYTIKESQLHKIIAESVKKVLSEKHNIQESKQPKVITESQLKGIISECVKELIESQQLDEGWKNWAMAGALGAASLFGGNKAYAQQDNLNTKNNTTQVVKMTKDGRFDLGDELRRKGYSEKEIKKMGDGFNEANIMMRNSKGVENKEIANYLKTFKNPSKSLSTKNIKVFNHSEQPDLQNYMNKFNERNAKKFKMFYDSDMNAFIMPINYTLENVKNELDNTFILGDFNI